MPRAVKQDAVWMEDHCHGTTLILVESTDNNPDFKQVDIIFIQSKALKGQLEREERDGVIGVRNLDDNGAYLVEKLEKPTEPMALPGAIQPKPRPTMRCHRITKNRSDQIFVKCIIETITLPAKQKYTGRL